MEIQLKYNRNSVVKEKKFIPLKNLEVYKLARKLSLKGWEIYQKMDWQTKKIIGDQFLSSLDSIGANIAEGYGRYHYLDQIKFYYNAMGFLRESCEHWLELLKERKIINEKNYQEMKTIAQDLSVKLNNFTASSYKQKNKQ
jgi:four helix bundle protein